MTCSEIHYAVDLYDLLDEQQRMQFDAHLATCASCRKYVAQAQRARNLVQAVAAARPMPDNAARLTANIMQNVAAVQRRQQRRGLVRQVASVVQLPVVRYAYALVSILLVAGFAYEATRPAALPVATGAYAATANSATLNTSGFLKNLKRDTLAAPTLLACLKVSQMSDGNLACRDCEKMYAKFYPKP